MASAVIGALRVNLSADTAAFNKGLSDAEKRAEAFGRVVGTGIRRSLVGLGATAAAVAGPAALGLLTKASMETIGAQVDLAKRVGASVAAIQTLQHAAQLSGTSQEALAKALGTLNARLGEAAREGAGPAYEALLRLNLTARELSQMDADQRIKALSDRMQELGLSTQAQASTLRDLGIRQQEINNLFLEGSGAIDQARADLEAWGVLLSDVDAEKVEAAGDAIDRIGTVMKGVGNQLAVRLSPLVSALAEHFSDAARETRGFGSTIDSVISKSVGAVGVLADAIVRIQKFMLEFQREMAEFDVAGTQVLPWRFEEFDEAQAKLKGINDRLVEITTTPLPSEQLDTWLAKAKEADVWRSSFDLGLSRGGGESEDGPTEAETDAATKLQDEMAKRLVVLQEGLLTERETELNAYAERMVDLEDFYRAGLITKQEYDELAILSEEEKTRRLKELDEETVKSANRAARQRAQAISSILGSVQSMIGTIFGDSKKAAIASAIINTAESVIKNLAAYPGPWGMAAAAAAAAAGAAQIASIRKTTVGGGGSPVSVGSGGGRGGGAGGGRGRGGEASSSTTLYVSGINPNDLYKGDAMRGLFEAINSHIKDGGKLVLA